MTRGLSAKRLLNYGSIILLVVIVLGYGIWRSRDILFGLRLSVSGIENGLSVTEPLKEVSGHSKHAVLLEINGRIVPISADGDFTDTLAFLAGSNIVTIRASDKFGDSVQKQYQVFYNAPVTPVVPEPVIEEVTPDTEPADETVPETPSLPPAEQSTDTVVNDSSQDSE